MRAVVAAMRERGGGSIVNFSSPQGIEGRHGMPAYTASKFAVRGLTKTAAIELGPLGIRVNAVVPGPTRTAMTERKGWTDADYDAVYGALPARADGRRGRDRGSCACSSRPTSRRSAPGPTSSPTAA